MDFVLLFCESSYELLSSQHFQFHARDNPYTLCVEELWHFTVIMNKNEESAEMIMLILSFGLFHFPTF